MGEVVLSLGEKDGIADPKVLSYSVFSDFTNPHNKALYPSKSFVRSLFVYVSSIKPPSTDSAMVYLGRK